MPQLLVRPSVFEPLDWLYCAMTTRHAMSAGEDRLDLADRLPSMAGLKRMEVVVGEQIHGCKIACISECNDPSHEHDRQPDKENASPCSDGCCPECGGHDHTEHPHDPNYQPLSQSVEIAGVDGLLTSEIGVMLAVYTADCVPIVLADRRTRLLAVVHAGREGTRLGIIQKTLRHLAQLDSRPSDLLAWIGPSICPQHYEVSMAIAEQFRNKFAAFPGVVEGRCLALSEINRRQLLRFGLPPHQIEVDSRCTFETDDLFYSYRRDGADAGRMATFAVRYS